MKSAVLALALVCAGCSSGFNREWRAAVAEAGGTAPRDLSGPWQGTWRSDANGHHGGLRCIVSRTDPAGGRGGAEAHRFHYHATFVKIFSATYEVTHRVRRAGNTFAFSGSQQITGRGGGLYRYEGTGTPERFRATFRSETDHGVFEMARPAAKAR